MQNREFWIRTPEQNFVYVSTAPQRQISRNICKIQLKLNFILETVKILLLGESQKVENFRLLPGTFSEGKFEIKALPIDQFSWIQYRCPILLVWSFLQICSFVWLSSCPRSRGKVFPLELHSEAFPGSKKNPRTYYPIKLWEIPNYFPHKTFLIWV